MVGQANHGRTHQRRVGEDDHRIHDQVEQEADDNGERFCAGLRHSLLCHRLENATGEHRDSKRDGYDDDTDE
jgi:hypothetical protein